MLVRGKADISQFRFPKLLGRSIAASQVHDRDSIDSIQSKLRNAASDIATAIPDVVSQAESVFTDIATAIPDVISQVMTAAEGLATSLPNTIEENIPTNLTVGTRQFCVGFPHNVSCQDFPLNMSSFIPVNIANTLGVDISDIQRLESYFAKITTTNILGSLILGVILTFAIIPLTMAPIFGWATFLAGTILKLRILRALSHFLFGLICCAFLAIPTGILYLLKSKIHQLPPWIDIQVGNVYESFMGSLGCAIAMVVLSSVLQFFF